MKIKELRDMSGDQLAATLQSAKETLFDLRIKSHMERLDSPSELKKNKKIIARILTILQQRAKSSDNKEQTKG
ncbi:MAG: 50S ribosomal protein L29 [Planctomycetaceae bacterium]|nr:50S ribosomal protein L29 [Planctomycetaceae bacterium]